MDVDDVAMARGAGKKRGLFADGDQSKRARSSNRPEYVAAFKAFDADGSGTIDFRELSNAMMAVKSSGCSLFHRHFNEIPCCWLWARFASSSGLTAEQFFELLDHVQNLKSIFEQVDVNQNGAIDCVELHRAFQASGIALDQATVAQVGRSYDNYRHTGSLEFDEFVQMRLEWDMYIEAWQRVTNDSHTISPGQLLQVLEEVKRSIEPVGTALRSQVSIPIVTRHGLLYSSMFSTSRQFQTQTCEKLIIRFGGGSFFLTFEQFCTMLVFMKEVKEAFCSFDENGDGSLSCGELSNAFTRMGMPMPSDLVAQLGRSYDMDSSGQIEFDEFLQMTTEWLEMREAQARFSAAAAAQLGPAELQELMGAVRVLYKVVNGTVQTLRPFSLKTCRWLVAKFGTCRSGEHFAKGLTYLEFLKLVQYLKSSYEHFMRSDSSKNGCISASELRMVFATNGLNLRPEVADNICSSYDLDNSGQLQFDEFIQMLVECQLYDQKFTAYSAQQLNAGVADTGMVTLDRSSFLALCFAIPRNLTGN